MLHEEEHILEEVRDADRDLLPPGVTVTEGTDGVEDVDRSNAEVLHEHDGLEFHSAERVHPETPEQPSPPSPEVLDEMVQEQQRRLIDRFGIQTSPPVPPPPPQPAAPELPPWLRQAQEQQEKVRAVAKLRRIIDEKHVTEMNVVVAHIIGVTDGLNSRWLMLTTGEEIEIADQLNDVVETLRMGI